MHPYLFGSVRAYPVSMAAAIAVGTLVVVLLARRRGVPPWRALVFQLALAAVGLFGGKLHSLFERDALHLLSWEALPRDGFRYPGALVAALLSLPLLRWLFLRRVPLAALADIVAISVPFALVPMRLGCFLYGCCFGRVSHLPWAMAFPPFSPASNYHAFVGLVHPHGAWSLPVHPLQLYLGAWALAVGLFLLWFRHRQQYDGQIALLFLAVHELGKALLEFVRTEETFQTGRYIQATSAALCTIAVGALIVAAIIRHQRHERGRGAIAVSP